MTKIYTFTNIETLNQAAARYIIDTAQEAVRVRGRFKIALSGGSTPLALFRQLALPLLCDEMPWQDTHFFWSDERCVPPSHAESNYFQVREALFKRAPVMPENIHRVQGELPPNAACREYLMQLRRYADGEMPFPIFDLVLLGLGDDGHTASLFPGTRAEEEWTQAALAVTAHYGDRPANRVSLTPLVFNAARAVLFLVTGSSKAQAVAATLQGQQDWARWPAQMVSPTSGTLKWFMDDAAGSALRHE
jgi:6-phosphogluconolactonase